MNRTLAGMLVAMLFTVAAVACGGDDSNEGNACTSTNDCGGNLTCQPVQGRQQDFCCPTPATESTKDTCHPSP